MSFITRDQPAVLERILMHLGEPSRPEHSTGPPRWMQILDAKQRMQEHPELYPEDCAGWDWDQLPSDERL